MATLRTPVLATDHFQGALDAPLVLVEYGDYQCPYCGEAYSIVRKLQDQFGASLCFVFRNFPLGEVHPEAEAAAETAEFAGANGKFWEMHDLLYENQSDLGQTLYVALVEELGLSASSFHAALKTGTYRERVRTDFVGGVRSGVNGTPAFYINGRRHDASYEFGVLATALKKRLRIT